MNKKSRDKIERYLMSLTKQKLANMLMINLDRLALLERAKNLENENAELKKLIETCQDEYDLQQFLKEENGVLARKNAELEQENAELKQKLENAILPKFRVGQEVFYLGTNKVFTGIITKTKITNSKKIQYSIRSNDNQLHTKNETDVFATEQEARDRLEELKNGKA